MQSILKLLKDTDAITKTKEKFHYYLGMARATAVLIDGEERKEGLRKICDFIMQESERGYLHGKKEQGRSAL